MVNGGGGGERQNQYPHSFGVVLQSTPDFPELSPAGKSQIRKSPGENNEPQNFCYYLFILFVIH